MNDDFAKISPNKKFFPGICPNSFSQGFLLSFKISENDREIQEKKFYEFVKMLFLTFMISNVFWEFN